MKVTMEELLIYEIWKDNNMKKEYDFSKMKGKKNPHAKKIPKTLTDRFYSKEELTKAEREKIHAGDIRLNCIQCNHCKELISSDNRHDYKSCKCGKVAVDGGSWYLRRAFQKEGDYTELSKNYKDI